MFICGIELININIFHILIAFLVNSLGFDASNVVPLQPFCNNLDKDMCINNCYSADYDEKLLKRALDYSDRFSKETPFCEFEQEGRLITLYGNIILKRNWIRAL